MQIFQDVSDIRPPIRFAIEIDGVRYRIFSYFLASKDSSIAVHSYFSSTHTWSKRLDIPPQDLPSNEILLKISEAEKEAEKFAAHKSAFHKSGILNIKDKEGKRLKGDKDIVSISFERIPESIRLCYIYPTVYNRYLRILKESKKHHNVLKLVGTDKKVPLMIEIRLSKFDFNLSNRLKESYKGFIAFVDRNTLSHYKLDIYTVFRRSPNSYFPSTEAFIREFY